MHGLKGGSWKRSVGHGHRSWAPGGNPGDERGAYRHHTPQRQFPTRLRHGNSAHSFDKIMAYANERMSLFVGKRHKRGRRFGFSMLIRSGNRLGLIDLHGTVVAPRPNKPWRAPTERRR